MSLSLCKSLPATLFPPTAWWAIALQQDSPVQLSGTVSREQPLSYNRYRIITANGAQLLSVPLKGGRKQRVPLEDLHIDFKHDWQRQHWGALFSAYGRAPYFEHYGPQLEALLHKGHERLEDLNREAISWLSKAMKIPVELSARGEDTPVPLAAVEELPAYHQVFEDRWGFVPGLSAIDLLMNEGPYAKQFLRGRVSPK